MTDLERPVVTCDIRLGAIVDDLTLDTDALTAVMREHGVSEEAIAAHTIHLSAEAGDGEEGYTTHGAYDYRTHTTTLFLGARTGQNSWLEDYVARRLSEREVMLGGTAAEGETERIIHNVRNQSCNETLFHETVHAIEDAVVSKEKREAMRRSYSHRLMLADDAKKMLAATAATAAMAAPLIEAYAGVSPSTIKTTFVGNVVIAGVAAVWASRRPSARQHYKRYLNSPWEAAARDYAELYVDHAEDPVALPLQVRFAYPE